MAPSLKLFELYFIQKFFCRFFECFGCLTCFDKGILESKRVSCPVLFVDIWCFWNPGISVP